MSANHNSWLTQTRPIGKLERLAYERHAADLARWPALSRVECIERGNPYWFDADAGQHVVDFFHRFLRHFEGEFAGKPFILEPWQQFVAMCIFGWKRANGTRRFREAWVEVARGNGKSPLGAGIANYMLIGDNEPGAQVYSAALDKDQAAIVWNHAKEQIKASPHLRKRVTIHEAEHGVKSLVFAATASRFMPLSAETKKQHGKNIACAIVDEVHVHHTRKMLEAIETGARKRRQPLVFKITTAGAQTDKVYVDEHNRAVQVIEGVIDVPSMFVLVCALDKKGKDIAEDDDWMDPANFGKANPNLGVSVKLDSLLEGLEKAKQMPAAQNEFRRLHLNEITEQSTRAIDAEAWRACSFIGLIDGPWWKGDTLQI